MLDLSDGDWFAVFRRIRRHWVWDDKPFSTGQAWIDLLARANHRESTFTFRASGPLTVLPRQIVATVKGLAEDWGWNRKRVRSFIGRARSDDMLKLEFRSWCPKTDTWMDRKLDTGIMLLTALNMPLRTVSDSEGTVTRTPKGTAKGQRPDSEGTAKGHIQECKEEQEGKEGEEKKEKSAPSARAHALVEKAVGLWNHGRAAGAWIHLTRGRVSKAAARLRDGFTEVQLIAVLKAVKESEFHQGANDRRWRCPGPEWCWQSQEKVEEWLGKIANPPKGGSRVAGPAHVGKYALVPGELEDRVRQRIAERDGLEEGAGANGHARSPQGAEGGGGGDAPHPSAVREVGSP